MRKRLSSLARSYNAGLNSWRHYLSVLPRRKKTFIAAVLIAAAVISFGIAGYDYWVIRVPGPAAGGSFVEGLVGEPEFLNPVLAGTNEVDRDLAMLLFAGLTKHDDDSNIVGDLAENFVSESRGRIYTFTLREGLAWPDGEPITADDVEFTIELIQNPEYQSPLQANWQGVRVEKTDMRTVRFTLGVPFVSFIENTTVGILPKHLWERIEPQNFGSAELNIKPVGAGPYVVKKISKDKSGSIRSVELVRNAAYHEDVYIKKITFRFYPSEDTLVRSYQRGDIDAMSLFLPQTKSEVARRGGLVEPLRMPRYFAVFFNEEKNAILEERSVRRALAYATDRKRLVEEVFWGEAIAQEGPLPPWYFTAETIFPSYEFDQERAREIIAAAKLDEEELAITLTTADVPELTQVASILKQTWEEVGFRVVLDIIPTSDIQTQTIRPRQYEALLFGEVLGVKPDPFSFWHSSQAKDPGLNLSLYEDKEVDALLEAARQTIDPEEQRTLYEEFQFTILEDIPAIFLYSPNYLYALPANVKGFSKNIIGRPSERLENVNDWYIKTTRTREH